MVEMNRLMILDSTFHFSGTFYHFTKTCLKHTSSKLDISHMYVLYNILSWKDITKISILFQSLEAEFV